MKYGLTAGSSQEKFALVVRLRTAQDVDASTSIPSPSLVPELRFDFFFFGGEVELSLSDPVDRFLFRVLLRRIFGLSTEKYKRLT